VPKTVLKGIKFYELPTEIHQSELATLPLPPPPLLPVSPLGIFFRSFFPMHQTPKNQILTIGTGIRLTKIRIAPTGTVMAVIPVFLGKF
jgi:hypothetical protein